MLSTRATERVGFSSDCLRDVFNLKGSLTGESEGSSGRRGGRCVSWRPGCSLPHLLLLPPALSRATSPFPACAHLPRDRRTNCGFGGEEATASAHALRGRRCHVTLLCFGKQTRQKHDVCWQESVPGSPRALAWSCPLRRGLEAQLGTEAAPGPAAAWPGEHPCPFPAHPLTKQPTKNQRDHPIKRTTGKEAVGHDERKRSSKTAEHWNVSEISLPSFFTQDIAVFSDVTN